MLLHNIMTRMGRHELLIIASCFILGLVPITTTNNVKQICPDSCRCTTEDYYITFHCPSLNFIKDLTHSELLNVESLDVSNSSLTLLDKHLLKKLVNLERLDLSNNRLTNVKHFPFLPKLTHLNLRSNLIKTLPGKQFSSLLVLDISHNHIREIPTDLVKWSKLKRLYLGGNVFTCSRESLDTRDILLDKKIKLIGNAICNSPAKFHGKSWIHAVDFDEYIKLHNQDDMLGDDPGASGDDSITGSEEENPWSTTIGPISVEGDSDFHFGSGDYSIVESEHDNTSTQHYEQNTEYYQEYGSADGSGDGADDTEDNIFPTTIVHERITTEKSIDILATKPTTENITLETTTSPANDTNGELSNVQANKSNESSIGTNIVMVLIALALVALLVYFIKKKKRANKERKRNRNRLNKAQDVEKHNAGIELLPKSPVVNEKQNGNTETVPLVHEQNGDLEKDEENNKINESLAEMRKNNVSNENLESPKISPPSQSPKSDVLSVTVRASEIPDSIPRTPILVDRRKDSDG